MSKEEIIKGNKLIAEFMGARTDYYPDEFMGEFSGSWESNLERFEYHKNWSWIMPVVERIGTIETPNDKYESGERIYVENFYPRTFGMKDDEGKNFLFRFNGCQLQKSESFVKSVYLGVVDFIKWHNEQKP